MNLEIINDFVRGFKCNKIVCDFIKSIQEKLDRWDKKSKMEDESKLITIYRDKMNIEKNTILNTYAKESNDKGEMYYIYSKNSKSDEIYNICICDEERSNEVLETNINELPNDAKVGSILRKNENEEYILDTEATEFIASKLEDLKEKILQEQKEYLESKRIDGHVYEVSDKLEDRVFLFDNSEDSGVQEEIEEIYFPIELIESAEIGNLFIYEEGTYKKI